MQLSWGSGWCAICRNSWSVGVVGSWNQCMLVGLSRQIWVVDVLEVKVMI